MKLYEAFLLAGVVGIGVSGCKQPASSDGGGDGGGDGSGPATSDGGPADSAADDGMAGDSTGPSDCVPGGLMCVCAAGECSGILWCVDDICVQGPLVSFDDPYPDVLAGLRIPVEVNADGDMIVWSQTAGPTVDLLEDQGQQIEVDIPPDMPDGTTFTLQVDASKNGVTLNDSIDITIRSASFDNEFPDVTDPTQLGTTDGLAFNALGMWVVSQEGFISLMLPGDDGQDPPVPPSFSMSYDLGGLPSAVSFIDNDQLAVANTMLSEVQVFHTNSGNVGTYFDSLDDGSPLGAVSYPLVYQNDGNTIVSNFMDGQLVYYDTGNPDDPDNPVPPSVYVLADSIGTNPSALAFGPEGDGLVYVGIEDAIVRVPYADGMIGMVTTYLDLTGMCGEPDGIAFDEGENMWVGCPATNSLYVARYVGDINKSTEVIRSWSDVGPGISRFADLAFGSDDFPDRSLFWTNLDDGTVGVLGVGLRRLDN